MIWEDIKFKTNGIFCIKLSNKFFVSRCIPYIYMIWVQAFQSILVLHSWLVTKDHRGP